ncbi:glucosaminidase domain-containing protein [Cohnella cellulosilytica]|uniref:Glucosaminidase domain-containing protein n=1 Tax=Cohnella cellulosilytica TaxID=986710 RepID=A0ABW2F4P6_9BACL
MRKITIRKWVACIVSAALTLTLGISYLTTNAYSASENTGITSQAPIWPIGGSSALALLADAEPDSSDPASDQAERERSSASEPRLYEYEAAADMERFHSAAASAAPVAIAKDPDREVHIAASAKPQTQFYEVTAYFLNVRANAYSKSKIIDVVEKGTRLEIVSKTEGGWLRIKGGGYVHGDYAEPAEGTSEGPAQGRAEEPADGTVLRGGIAMLPQLTGPAKTGDEAAEDKPAAEKRVEAEQEKAPVSPTSAVETDSGLTEEDIAVMFKGTELAGHGLEEAVLEVEETYGINALFTIAVMKLESGNGSSRLAKNKNNLFGLNATGSDPHRQAFSFETKGDSVKKFGQLLADKYVDKGYTTIEKIATKYCPANSKWPSLVKNIMKKDYKKLHII